MYRIYRLVNSLSIDVAMGAVASAGFFAHAVNSEVPTAVLACLGITVWLIYTADHLLDVYDLKTQASTTRHRLHQRYFKLIASAFLVLLILDVGIILLLLPARIITYGGVLAGFVVVYFLIQKRLLFLKEIFGATLYTLGVILPTLAVSQFEISKEFFTLAMLFFSIALLNLLLFSWYDVAHDHFHKYPSFVTAVGKATALRVIVLLFVAGLMSLALGWRIGLVTSVQTIIYGCMMLTLLWILAAENRFCEGDRYRMLGDLIFLFPLLVFVP